MKKFNELNKLKTASVATLMLFTAPAAINGLTLAPSVYAAQETKAPTTNSTQLKNPTNQPNSTAQSSNEKTQSHRSSYSNGFWWYWVGRHFGASQPYHSSYFEHHGGKYDESKMTVKEKENLNKKHGNYIGGISKSKSSEKSSTTNKPSTDTTKAGKSKGANVHDGNAKSGKGSKAGHATDGHAGIGGNTGAHDTTHGG